MILCLFLPVYVVLIAVYVAREVAANHRDSDPAPRRRRTTPPSVPSEPGLHEVPTQNEYDDREWWDAWDAGEHPDPKPHVRPRKRKLPRPKPRMGVLVSYTWREVKT